MTHSLKDWLVRARREGFAIGAFNAANLEVVKAIGMAAEASQSPVIIESSQGEVDYFGFANFLAVVKNFREEMNLPIFTNLDHGKEVEKVKKAIELGFDMVHFDGSDLPEEENLSASGQLAQLAHAKGVLIEVEFDKIQRGSQAYEEKSEEVPIEGHLTDPEKVREMMVRTGADLLAVSIGNLHGVYQTPEEIDLLRLEKLRGLGCFLTLHGGSGINEEQLKKAIGLGIVKINVNTDLRLAYRETLENVLKGSEEVKIYQIMPPVIAAMQKVVEDKVRLFGSGGKAGEIEKVAVEAGD
jgi:fructose-bisphosphate aldolase class II